MTSLQWAQLNNVVLQCGSIHEPKTFSKNAIQQVRAIVPFDQGRVYFFNDKVEVSDEFLLDVDKSVTRAYHEYYSSVSSGRYSATRRAKNFTQGRPPVRDWTQERSSDEFYTEYLIPQGIRYSTGFLLHDSFGTPKVIFCMDRTGRVNFSEGEMESLYYLSAHLDNLHRNFYVSPPNIQAGISDEWKQDTALTPREGEIATLLCAGLSPEAVAQKLFISRKTVYKHISHIHAKLNVSTQQELMVKLLK